MSFGAILGAVGGFLGGQSDRRHNRRMWERQTVLDTRRINQARTWANEDAVRLRAQQLEDMNRNRQNELADMVRARRLALADRAADRQDAAVVRQQSLLDQSQHFVRTRRAAERAGINPLAALGMLPTAATTPVTGGAGGITSGGGGAVGGVGGGGFNYSPGNAQPFSSNYAESLSLLGNGIGDAIDSMVQNQQLKEENKNLAKDLRAQTLRPKVGSIFAEREAIPSVAEARGIVGRDYALSSGNSSRSSGSSFNSRGDVVGSDGLLTKAQIDPRREVQNDPIVTDPGVVMVDNPKLGRPFPVPAIQGEVIEPAIVTVPLAKAFDVGQQWGEADNERQAKVLKQDGRRVYRIGGKIYAQQNPNWPLRSKRNEGAGYWSYRAYREVFGDYYGNVRNNTGR